MGESGYLSQINWVTIGSQIFKSVHKQRVCGLSSHSSPAKKELPRQFFFYPLRKQWYIINTLSVLYLISPSGLYIITPKVCSNLSQ